MCPKCYITQSSFYCHWTSLPRFCQVVCDEKPTESEPNNAHEIILLWGTILPPPGYCRIRLSEELYESCIYWNSQAIVSEAWGVVASIEAYSVYMKRNLKTCMGSTSHLRCVSVCTHSCFSQHHRACQAFWFFIFTNDGNSFKPMKQIIINRTLVFWKQRGKRC